MAQYYTLDEASEKLGLTTDEFRKKLATQWKQIRRFPDGATLRFQARDIDELARQAGRTSDPDLKLTDAPLALADEPAPSVGSKISSDTSDTLFIPSSSDDFVPLADDNSVTAIDKAKKPGSDSDVKLESAGGGVRPAAREEPTEVLEVKQKKSGLREKGSFDVKSDTAAKPPASKGTHTTSEFELSLTPDSDEFDLELTDDSDEVPIGTINRKKGPRSGDSGINLQDPADSGISLEKESSDFELKLDPATGPSSDPQNDSDSEFELTLDEGSPVDATTAFEPGEQKDIFETDFELPAIDDSGSEVKADSDTSLEESDFDLSVDDEGSSVEEEDSASEVVAIEEEGVEDELEAIEDAEVEARPVAALAPVAPEEWGALPVAVLVPCVLVMFFVGLMGYELLHSMWGYHTGSTISGPIVSFVASFFGDLPGGR